MRIELNETLFLTANESDAFATVIAVLERTTRYAHHPDLLDDVSNLKAELNEFLRKYTEPEVVEV